MLRPIDIAMTGARMIDQDVAGPSAAKRSASRLQRSGQPLARISPIKSTTSEERTLSTASSIYTQNAITFSDRFPAAETY
jgi:hypothetical protein